MAKMQTLAPVYRLWTKYISPLSIYTFSTSTLVLRKNVFECYICIYLERLASRSLLDSPPKNMSELIDLAFPNLLTASELELGAIEAGAGDLLGLI